jgi:hypothetical protein
MIKVDGIWRTVQALLACRTARRRLRFCKSYRKDFVAPGTISFEVKNGETCPTKKISAS